jgi:hypothetical protein
MLDPTPTTHSLDMGLPAYGQGDNQQVDGEDWELNEGDLPACTSLFGSKTLLDEYSDDETTSKKTKAQV